MAAAFPMKERGEGARVYEASVHVGDPKVVGIDPEPSALACLIACVTSAH